MSVTFRCKFLRETEAAYQVVHDDTGEVLWIPISQVERTSKDRDGKGSMQVTDWIARVKGLETE